MFEIQYEFSGEAGYEREDEFIFETKEDAEHFLTNKGFKFENDKIFRQVTFSVQYAVVNPVKVYKRNS